MELSLGILIPWIAALGAAVCGLCATKKPLAKVAGIACVLSLFIPFLITLGIAGKIGAHGEVVTAWKWIHIGGVEINFGYYFDKLTLMMLLVVTGIGTLIAWYATGYMKGDRGYARFFMGVSLFIFAMTNLVMGDNLVLLYLGWEGVGLCSYYLIGFYYEKPKAVNAAKKAFIVNRIGDLGFALGIWMTYKVFGSVQYADFLPAAQELVAGGNGGQLVGGAKEAFVQASAYLGSYELLSIPFLLMLGAFGKSAQIPLFVWLPDAMAGPTPVSALVHAATMVTSGVYMISRLIPLYELSPASLSTVALIGGATCLFAGTIALCNNDLKGVFAYSTVSQLGYMFLGVGALSTFGGMFHLFTHAFFKALLFLTAGSVMHALAGQLDIRTMSGLRKKMPVTCWLMFAGCLALAGFPFTSGFFSKDTILAESLAFGINGLDGNGSTPHLIAAIMGILCAGLTAYYTFRLWFKVFMGEERYEMGDEHHAEDDHGHDGHDDHAHHAPHEMPFFGMNLPLVALAIGALLVGFAAPVVKTWVHDSTANAHLAPVELDKNEEKSEAGHALVPAGDSHVTLVVDEDGHGPHSRPTPPEHAAEGEDHASQAAASMASDDSEHGAEASHHPHHAELFGRNLHDVMMVLSGIIAILGIAVAAFFHWLNRPAAAAVGKALQPLVTLLEQKYYVDEIYDAIIVRPLRGLGYAFWMIDDAIISSLVLLVGWVPGGVVGRAARPFQSGRLQGYGLGMAGGVAMIALIVLFWMTRA